MEFFPKQEEKNRKKVEAISSSDKLRRGNENHAQTWPVQVKVIKRKVKYMRWKERNPRSKPASASLLIWTQGRDLWE